MEKAKRDNYTGHRKASKDIVRAGPRATEQDLVRAGPRASFLYLYLAQIERENSLWALRTSFDTGSRNYPALQL